VTQPRRGALGEVRRGDNVPMAALFQVAGSALFTAMAALVKLAGAEATPMQAVLYRSVVSLVPLSAELARRRISPLSPRWTLLLVRGLLGFLALACYFFTIARVQLANALALQQLAPIFVAFLAVCLLRERPRRSHYLLAALCLLGALLVVRPTQGVVSLNASDGVLSSRFSAMVYVTVRALTRTEPTVRIVLWFSSVASILALPLTLPGWRWPSLRAHLLLIGAGLLAAPAQTRMPGAYRRAPAHVAAAVSYRSVPRGYLLGLLVGREPAAGAALLGIAGRPRSIRAGA